MLTTIGSGEQYIKIGAELILQGEVVAFPTETVYGLGADAFNAEAVKKIYEAKGRPQDNPLIVHLVDYKDLETVAKDIPAIAADLYKAFCPGPLTMVLKKSPIIPDIVTAGLDTVGVRFPSHPVAIEFIKLSGAIAAPSANASKHISPTTALHVLEDLNGKIPLIIDGGASEVGIESTIIDLTKDTPEILRPGIITIEEIEKIVKVNYCDKKIKTALAPGMKYIHYSPYCDCVIAKEAAIEDLYQQSIVKNIKTLVLATDDTVAKLKNVSAWKLGKNEQEVANRLYSLLRKGEKSYDLIIIENLSDSAKFHSVMNRIEKAAKRKE